MAGQEQNSGSHEPFIEDGLTLREIDMAASTAGTGVDLPHIEIPVGADEMGIMSDGLIINDRAFQEGITAILGGEARSRSSAPYVPVDTVNRLHGIPDTPRKNRSVADSKITGI